jgi:hypothetical protein
MPPPGAGVPALSEDEKMMFARWIDLGAQIDSPDPQLKTMGLFADDIKPVLTMSAPRAGATGAAFNQIRLGLYDNYSGINRQSLSVKADFAVNGKAAGSELAGDFTSVGDGVWAMNISPVIVTLRAGKITARVKDLAGNESVIERSFSKTGNRAP